MARFGMLLFSYDLNLIPNTGGTPKDYSKDKMTGKSEAKEALNQALDHLGNGCKSALGDKLGTLKSGVSSLAFWDSRRTVDGEKHLNEVVEGTSSQNLYNYALRTGERVIRDASGRITNNVVLGSLFFSNAFDASDQQRALVHGSFHAVLKKTDNEFAKGFGLEYSEANENIASMSITKWLLNDCKK